ncbi:hypothetical protein BaRGS_00001869 [Batillaria attramentaria]|uniref:G-protein coupled receptors family 1 profile domain-containing protein n=1 Tax=Batillaria attramentaria TaxID=370345 RepID=A0ABD0M757_9CAEN
MGDNRVELPETLTGNVSNETSTASTYEERSLAENISACIFFIIIILFAIGGNVLVILAVYMYRRLRDEVANLFIVNLSITDLSSATVVMLSSVIAVSMDRWALSGPWCRIVCGANYCFIIVSMLTLMFISMDRYVAIVYSLHYPLLVTKRRVLYFIVYAWIQGFAFGLTPILFNWIEYDYWEATCAIQWHIYGNPVLIYVIVAFILCFLLPGVLLTVAYCKVFSEVKKIKPRAQPQMQLASIQRPGTQNGHHDRNSVAPDEPPPPPKPQKYSESSKAVRSLLIVVLAYFVCMTPFSVTKLIKVIISTPDALPGYANLVATFFQYMSSAVNPLIYGLFRRDFQKAFLYLLWRTVRNRDSTGATSININSISM